MKIKLKVIIALFCITLIYSSCSKENVISDNNITSSVSDYVSPTLLPKDISDVNTDITVAPISPVLDEFKSSKITYEDITFEDMYMVNFKENCGVSIDLNGDEKKEHIYVCKEGIYINDIFFDNILGSTLYQYEAYKSWWLLDVDKEDGLIELLFVNTIGEFVVWHCTDTFSQVGNFINFNTDKDIRYANFTNNKSISFEYTANVLERSLLDLTYYLDSEGKLAIMPGEYTIPNDTKLSLLKEIKLYSIKDLSSDFSIIQPQDITLMKTDGLNWTNVIAEDGTEGWIYTETINDKTIVNNEIDKYEYFEGFDTAG